MSSLGFLSVDGADGALARSALHRAHEDLGATFEERDGWLVPVSIPGEEEHRAVGIADLSASTKLELRPAGEPVGGEGIAWYEISPRRALVLCAPALGATVRSQIGGRLSLDVTGAWTVIAIVGPEAPAVVRRLTHLHDFPCGGEIAHVQGHVLPRENGTTVLVPQELGQYVWEVAVDRASAFGGGPVGVDAL